MNWQNMIFRLLIGDDSLSRQNDCQDTILNISAGIAEVTQMNYSEAYLQEQIGMYHCERFPLPMLEEALIMVVTTPQATIQAARQYGFDWIATDLDFGPGAREGGIQVIASISEVRSVKAIVTSTTDMAAYVSILSLDQKGVDHIIVPHFQGSKESKWKLLGKTIGERYSFPEMTQLK